MRNKEEEDMSKTKFRSLGMGFLVAALILALVTVDLAISSAIH